ncbi:hypothetical protein [Arthrobacter sp. zg-Y895]|uniref:hypothetical protein n=1 Tax=Arthrobacter sp. zg-Y895 TaxID=2886933 RepID=UPI001D159599|nr:hypothetical protein [Arthrobacter sp. zg-Y895]MCC3301641.1 hypothetical protein [Arthrobacter sp. zg-Y895]
MEILAAFGVASEWSHVTAVAKGAGFRSAPEKRLFDEIAQRRHFSAHLADHSTDVLLLRATPSNLISFAFAFDALISSAARCIAAGKPVEKGRAAVTLTLLDEVNGTTDAWHEASGYIQNNGSVPAQNPTTRTGTEHEAVSVCRATLNEPTDILLTRRWNGAQLEASNWHTMGV